MIEPVPAAAPAAEPVPVHAPPARKKLDLSHVSPPDKLEAIRVEEMTIDGICGVY